MTTNISSQIPEGFVFGWVSARGKFWGNARFWAFASSFRICHSVGTLLLHSLCAPAFSKLPRSILVACLHLLQDCLSGVECSLRPQEKCFHTHKFPLSYPMSSPLGPAPPGSSPSVLSSLDSHLYRLAGPTLPCLVC